MKIPKQAYTAEFKELALKRFKNGQSVSKVCKALGLSDQTLRNLVKAAAEGKLSGAGGKVVTPEEMELSRLRAENGRLKRELEIIKKAAAYFARDVLLSTPGLPSREMRLRSPKCATQVHGIRYTTHADMKAANLEYIEVFYNRKRQHSTLGYKSPMQFLANWLSRQHQEKLVA